MPKSASLESQKMEKRCMCGARIVFVSEIKLDDGRIWYHYKCGICGSIMGEIVGDVGSNENGG